MIGIDDNTSKNIVKKLKWSRKSKIQLLKQDQKLKYGIDDLNFFFSSRRRHTRWTGDWSSDVCSSDLYIFSGYIINLESPTKVTQSYDLTPFLKKQLEKDNADQLSTPLEEISTEFDLHQYHFKVYFSEIINRSEERRVGKECRSR